MATKIKIDALYDDKSSEVAVISEGDVSIGREAENIIMIDSPAVSRRHGHIFEINDYWLYEDLGSANGSFINEKRVDPYQLIVLHDQDVLRFANFSVRLNYLNELNKPACLLVYKEGELVRAMPCSNNDSLVVGGKNGQIAVAGEDSSAVQFYIFRENDQFVMKRSQLKAEIQVDGKAVADSCILGDSENLTVGEFRIVAIEPIAFHVAGEKTVAADLDKEKHDFAAEDKASTEVVKPEEDHGTEKRPKRVTAEYSREAAAQSMARRSKNLVGKQYFRGNDAETDPDSTLAMRHEEFYSHVGAGMNMTQRLSAVQLSSRKKGLSDQMYALIGMGFILVALLLLGFVFF